MRMDQDKEAWVRSSCMVLAIMVSKCLNFPLKSFFLRFEIRHQMEVFLAACCMICLLTEGFRVRRAPGVSLR
ncbi:hypothetical protein HanXRQr2_Chr14g0637031 [Helianthus annuus]|uniref:Uncharacterized protein n=1 Tax=Helianthus annuus TaxID=4232 RepID=A0A9K3E9K7_HELAN|nr:hypothetical protein HanXRQr2_Chr14g0637031 [Helianthus annuus]KAJ0839789.1 hypothetical protein HanPSC8_Chr14g0611041 [Helianthus annuus]